MPDGGVIEINVENVETRSPDGSAADFVKISVADTGQGMPPEVKARVFEPFFTTKDVDKGSGLGLPQVYGFVQQSSGQVTLDSAVGIGTIVTLLLAALAAHARPWARRGRRDDTEGSVRATRWSHPAGRGRSRSRRAVTRAAALAGIRGDARQQSGCRARRVRQLAPDSTSCSQDIMMPGGVSGLQLAREIRRRYPNLPILLTTGYVEAAADMTDGEFELLPKPFTLEALADALGIDLTQHVR
jgi:CheY-like chemotaxis protein